MGAVIQQALDAAAHEHSGSPSVIADEQQINPGSDDLIARLQKLKKLHEAGLIDNDEYAAKKSDLLKNQIGRASCRERVCKYRVDLGGRRIIKKKKHNDKKETKTNKQNN